MEVQLDNRFRGLFMASADDTLILASVSGRSSLACWSALRMSLSYVSHASSWVAHPPPRLWGGKHTCTPPRKTCLTSTSISAAGNAQAWHYFMSYPRDHWILKVLVCAPYCIRSVYSDRKSCQVFVVWLFGTIQLVLVSWSGSYVCTVTKHGCTKTSSAYDYTVTNFGNFSHLLMLPPYQCVRICTFCMGDNGFT
jgi:hypothetical protein